MQDGEGQDGPSMEGTDTDEERRGEVRMVLAQDMVRRAAAHQAEMGHGVGALWGVLSFNEPPGL